jgi:SOS response regulatory protein OraA/RecX
VARITALTARKGGRVVVELDGAEWRVFPGELVVRLGLAVDEALSRPRLREIRRELRRTEALEQAKRALRRRDLSSQQLRERLDRPHTAPAVREEVVATLEAIGVVDDARIARRRAESMAGRGMGDAAIRFDLARQGVATELVEQAVAELEPERDRARRIIAAEGEGLRTARLLARRGFGDDAIEAAAGTLDW